MRQEGGRAAEQQRRPVRVGDSGERVVGIDLGTTNSLVAVVTDGRPRVLNVDGAQLLPSVVGMDPEGVMLVGEPARNQYVAAPERTVRSIKRHMGDPAYRAEMGGRTFAPEEISAFILKHLANAASAELGEPVQRVVITVPAYFSDRQRQATMRAGELAGLDVVRLLHEPTAAALVYGLESSGLETCLVYDLGGGTFDVSVVELGGGVTEVRASHGNRRLGGDDFDQLIVDELVATFQRKHHLDLRQDRAAMARLWRAAEQAKIHLSDHAFAEIREEFLASRNGRALHLETELSRLRLEEMIGPLLQGTLESVRQALRDAQLDRRALDAVLLVGGSTRIPAVRDLVAEELGVEPRQEVHPDLAVALGAAVQGAIASGQDVGSVLVDVCPHSLGVRALSFRAGVESDDVFVPLIRRNTAIPVSRSEVFSTMYPEQTSVLVQVYQGEEPVASRNGHLGDILFKGLSPDRQGGLREVLVAFDYDINGILHVAAVDRRNGRREEMRLHTGTMEVLDKGGLAGEAGAVLRRLQELRPHLDGEPLAQLDALLQRADGLGATPEAEALAAWQEQAADFLLDHAVEY